jgi:HSP20 family protein
MKSERSNQRPFKLSRQFYDFFKMIFGQGSSQTGLIPGEETVWTPPADLYREDGGWVVRVELPGVNPNDISVSVVDDRLIIRGERKLSEGLKSEYCILHECAYGPFERIVTLPAPVSEDRIKTSYQEGILSVAFPATEEQGRKTEIQSEEPPEEAPKAA